MGDEARRDSLGAGELALLAALGHGRLLVRKRPTVAVLVTGDELVPPTAEAGAGQIYDSNSIVLRALVTEAGAELVSSDKWEIRLRLRALLCRVQPAARI